MLELNIVNKADVNKVELVALSVRLLTGDGLCECTFVPGMHVEKQY